LGAGGGGRERKRTAETFSEGRAGGNAAFIYRSRLSACHGEETDRRRVQNKKTEAIFSAISREAGERHEIIKRKNLSRNKR